MACKITAKTSITGLVGNPIEHSLSPIFQNRLCEIFNIDSIYLPFNVAQGDLEKIIKAFKALNIKGFNVTIPYKTDILNFLNEVSDEALLMESVNTVRINKGKLYGFNTDGLGFIRALQSQNVKVKDKNSVILGAGGAARAAAIKLAQHGCKRIVILNRTEDKAKNLADMVNRKIADIAVSDELSEESIKKYAADCDIVVNTTPVGMSPNEDNCPVSSEDIFINKPVIFDMVYNPIKTKFLNIAETNLCKIINGMGMLIYQGISSFEIWHEVNVPLSIGEELKSDLEEYFTQMQDFK